MTQSSQSGKTAEQACLYPFSLNNAESALLSLSMPWVEMRKGGGKATKVGGSSWGEGERNERIRNDTTVNKELHQEHRGKCHDTTNTEREKERERERKRKREKETFRSFYYKNNA